MWEREFAHLQYRYVISRLKAAPARINGARRAKEKASPAKWTRGRVHYSSLAKLDDFDATLYFLDDNEVNYLQEEIKREFSTPCARGHRIAADVFENQRIRRCAKRSGGLLDYFLLILLRPLSTETPLTSCARPGYRRTSDRRARPQKQRLTQLGELMSDPNRSANCCKPSRILRCERRKWSSTSCSAYSSRAHSRRS